MVQVQVQEQEQEQEQGWSLLGQRVSPGDDDVCLGGPGFTAGVPTLRTITCHHQICGVEVWHCGTATLFGHG
jgi:hypothetical protein